MLTDWLIGGDPSCIDSDSLEGKENTRWTRRKYSVGLYRSLSVKCWSLFYRYWIADKEAPSRCFLIIPVIFKITGRRIVFCPYAKLRCNCGAYSQTFRAFCTINVKNTHENLTNLFSGLWKHLLREPNASDNMDQCHCGLFKFCVNCLWSRRRE